MTTRFIDPDRFVLLAGLVDWAEVSRRFPNGPPASLLAEQRGIGVRMVQLRWTLSPELGLPTEAFKVWRRPALPTPGETQVTVDTSRPLPGWRLHALPFDAALLRVRFDVQSPTGTTVIALAQPNLFSAPIDMQTLAQGIRTTLFAGPAIRAFAVFGDVDIQQVVAATTDDAASRDAGWELIEIVGLPVDQTEWANVFDHAADQGLIAQLTDPRSAALDRWRRGAPFYGWDAELLPGEAAPPWQLADPEAMIKVARVDVLPDLRDMLTTLAPNAHASHKVTHSLPADGAAGTAKSVLRPLVDLAYSAATDPLASLILGYGTAFADVDLPPIVLSDRAFLGDKTRSDFDFMVTALWGKGLDGQSDPVELAAIAPAASLVTRPPAPANLVARVKSQRPPDAPDLPFRVTNEYEWAMPMQGAVARAVCYASARRDLPAGITTALIGPRKFDTALQTVGVSTSPERLLAGRGPIAGDGGHLIGATPQPNVLRYAVAHQNLFGVFSGWSTRAIDVGEPPVQKVTIVTARLATEAPASGSVCPTRLVVDFSWDWSARRPLVIEFRGRFFAQAKRDMAPGDLSVPGGLDRTFPGGGPAFVIEFDAGGFVLGAAASRVVHLSDDGQALLSAVDTNCVVTQQNPSAANTARRYRVTIDAMSIDHGLAGHVGMSLWARGRERAGIQRIGPFGAAPKLVSSSDPRAPVIAGEREDVRLASMGDGKGEHRARLEWPSYGGAVGYFVYHAEESKIRSFHAMGDASRALTLSERLAQLRAKFQQAPEKRAFNRVNQSPIAATSTEVTLPRGTKEIHLYVVVGVGAGGVESAWPTSADPNCGKRPFAFAAPQIAVPSPPELEVARVHIKDPPPAVHRARVIMRAKPGVVASRIDLHRVASAEAALDVDAMGPPIARITGSTAQWTVTPHTAPAPGESQPLARIEGLDAAPGSWRPIFYRAVAWSDDDPERGKYGGRSRPSSVQEVIVPPADPPDVSALTIAWPGGPIGDVLAQATIGAPIGATPLGAHKIRVEALIEDAAGKLEAAALFPPPAAQGAVADDRLIALPTAPSGAGSAIWRTPRPDGGEGCVLNVRIERPAFETPARVRVLFADPLGRATERLIDAPTASPLPAPDINDLQVRVIAVNRAGLTFSTSIDPVATPLGSYRLTIVYVPRRTLGFPPTDPQPRTADIDLDKIRRLRPGEDLALDPADLPVRRVAAANAATGIAALLRGRAGTVSVTLTAPDGRSASERRSF